MSRVAFSIPGEPKGKGRPRAHARIVMKDDEPTAVVSMHTPADTVAAEKTIRDLFAKRFPQHRPWSGGVMIKFTAVFQTPSSFNRALKAAAAEGRLYCTRKPDKDNIEKLIVDALNGLAWVDDSQVMGGGVKRYGSPARVDVELQSLDSPDTPPTPGQKRAEGRVEAMTPGEDLRPRSPRRENQTKADISAYSPKAQERIRAALAREAGRG